MLNRPVRAEMEMARIIAIVGFRATLIFTSKPLLSDVSDLRFLLGTGLSPCKDNCGGNDPPEN